VIQFKFCIVFSLIVFFFTSCSNQEEASFDASNQSRENNVDLTDYEKLHWQLNAYEKPSQRVQKIGEVLIGVKYTSALNFIERTGRKDDALDEEKIKDETVFFLEFKSLNISKKDPLLLNQCELNYEEAVKYLSFELEKQIQIEQNGKIFSPNGLHFERDFNVSDRMRVIAFFKGVQTEQDFKFLLDDKLFGGGRVDFPFVNL
jgi:hypothetical protein